MKTIIFTTIISTILLSMFYDLKITSGLNLLSLVSFMTFMFLVIYEMATERIWDKKIPALSVLICICLFMLLNIGYFQLYGKISIPLIARLRELKNWFLQPFVFYYLSFLLVDKKRSAKTYLLYLLIILSLMNIISLLSLILGINIFPIAESYLDNGRFTGFGNPNKTAYLLCMMIPLMYYFVIFDSSARLKLLFEGFIFFSFLTVLISGSRGGILCLVIVFSGMSIKLKSFKPLKTLIIFCIIIMFILVINDSVQEKFFILMNRLTLIASNDLGEATSSRTYIWSAIIEYISSEPRRIIFGSGLGVTNMIGLEHRAHNLYLRVIVEFGIIGIIFLFALIRKILNFLKKYSVNKYDSITPFIQISIYSVLASFMFTDLGLFSFMAFIYGFAFAYMHYESQTVRKNLKFG